MADIAHVGTLLGICPLAGMALLLWYKLLKPFDQMLKLSVELERMRDGPGEYRPATDSADSRATLDASLESAGQPVEQGSAAGQETRRVRLHNAV